METLIEAVALHHRFDIGRENQIVALQGVDLKIRRGEFVAIIGRNGSGKSTLAKHFNALLLPTDGYVLVRGLNSKDPEAIWEIRRCAGMVFQNPDNQIVAPIVEEDVAFGPENLGFPPEEIRRRVEEALDLLELKGFEKKEPHRLSGGQKQRLAIAGVLAMKPECIILDEATAMLDPCGRREVLQSIRRLNKEEGITVIHITHYMDEAVEADRVIVMEGGRIQLDGKPWEVFPRVHQLKQLGLDVPPMVELAHQLRAEGLDIPAGVLSVDDMVAALCQC